MSRKIVLNVIFLLCAIQILSACSDHAETTAKIADNNEHKIFWFGNDENILVNNWIYSLKTSTFEKIKLVNPLSLKHTQADVLFSPLNSRIAYFNGRSKFILYNRKNKSNLEVNIPTTLKIEAQDREALVNTLVWAHPNRIFVHQFHPYLNQNAMCNVYNLDTNKWKTNSNGCFNEYYKHVWSVQPLGYDLYALTTGDEGVSAVSIVKLTENEWHLEQQDIAELITGAIVPGGIVLKDKNSAYYLSHCELTQDQVPDCSPNYKHTDKWVLYEWSFRQPKGTLLKRDIPIGTAYSRRGLSRAWLDGKSLCIQSEGQTKKQCQSLPES